MLWSIQSKSWSRARCNCSWSGSSYLVGGGGGGGVNDFGSARAFCNAIIQLGRGNSSRGIPHETSNTQNPNSKSQLKSPTQNPNSKSQQGSCSAIIRQHVLRHTPRDKQYSNSKLKIPTQNPSNFNNIHLVFFGSGKRCRAAKHRREHRPSFRKK